MSSKAMPVWKIKEGRVLPEDASFLSQSVHAGAIVSSITERLLTMRRITTETERHQFFSPDYATGLPDPFLFSQMSRVVERIRAARETKERVGIFADYDVDGITSSAILRETLEAVGLSVSVYIPDKVKEGHGLHINALDFFQKQGIKLVMTVDCGMTNHREIEEAVQRGMEVIVIDHHHVPKVLPKAFAIVNPKLKDAGYPFTELCGAGTTFKVAQAVFKTFLPEQEDQIKWLLDLVAIGTVADCMPLIGENRVIVKYGLIVLSKTRRIGLQEMFAVGRIPIDEEHSPDTRTIGFQIAPRLNAAGRMAHSQVAHDLIMEKDRAKARLLALEIEGRNVERQKISTYTTELVRKVAENEYPESKFIFAVSEHYPFGIVGLVAGRIAHQFNKPACVLQKGETESQGSLRSIPAVSIIEALEECAELLEKFGGHSQAAGLTIKNENLATFHEKLNGIIEKRLAGIAAEPEINIDLNLSPYHLTPQLMEEIKRFAPFGEGNREPVFLLEGMVVDQARLVGKGNKHLKLTLQAPEGNLKSFDAIGFGLGEAFGDLGRGECVDVVFHLEENAWNGTTRMQLKLVDMRRSV